MSNNIHHTSHSRSSSIGDQNAENDISVYATPRLDTPFVTPNSTPRLIHCRLNPVTTVRQHVPLKINFTKETHDSTSDQAALSKFNEIKPMNTKKVKCVIQTNPSYQEGDGDQAVASNSKHPTKKSNEFVNNSVSSHCHPEGDVEIEATPGITNNDNQLADDFQSVAVIEKEIELMDRFVKDSIERLQKNCDIKTNSDGCDVLPTANNCDHNNKGEKSKSDKVSKCIPGNKNFCTQEQNLPAGHKCDKKKFYDPEDIRKYMLKKKTERIAKEKEERCKKESEALALKKKSEATKNLVSKTRIPVLRSHHINEPEAQIENKGKNFRGTKSLSLCPKTAEDVKIPKQMCLNDEKPDYQRRYSKNLPQCNDTGENPITMNKNEPKSTQNFAKNSTRKVSLQRSNSDDIFVTNSNRVINQSTDNNRKISISEVLPSTEHDSLKAVLTKTRSPEDKMRKHTSVGFPEELDVLKSKNPYNFLNILKGKVNLAKNSVDDLSSDKDLPDDLLTEAFSPSLLKKSDHLKLDRDQFLEDIIKRRIKIGNSAALSKKLNDLKSDEESENVEPIKKIAETSPPKNNLTFRIWPSGKNDKTYTVLNSVEKSNNNIINDKNLSLDISGIKSLSPDDKKSSKKLFPKDEFVPSKINAPDDALLTDAIESNLDRTLTLESLQADNVSLALPESFAKKDDKDAGQLSLKDLSVDVRKLLEDESMFRSGIIKGADTSSVIGKTSEKALSRSSGNFGLNESSIVSSDDLTNLSTTAVFLDIYDQMVRNEDEKLSQILKKIHQQKIALNKYLKTEVFALESKKNIYRESKEEEKIKAIKKRQRAILLKITKNIQELEKMKKSVIDTVDRRKSEILRQKNAMKERKEQLKQKFVSPKKRKSEGNNKTFVISKQTNTLFMGISSSSSTSMVIENGENEIQEDTKKDMDNLTEEGGALVKNSIMKDIATSPVNFDTGISIKFELDPNKLLQLKNLGEIIIDPLQLQQIGKTNLPQSLSHESTDDYPSLVNEREKSDKNSGKIKIKRPLSPIVLPPSRKVSQLRRLSSSSDVTFASPNDTTTDQSDVELRISALQEQLRQRKLEAERLRREEKQLRKEKLRAKEQSLLKQLEAYDQYIQKVTNMLSENRSVSEIAKPQIKPVTKRSSSVESADKLIKHADFKEPSTTSHHDTDVSVKNKIYDDIDGENTEDSEKHLRKADSGILMESEVTEVSENVEIRKSKSESEIHSDVKSERIAEKFDSEAKNGGGSKSMDNFLQLINDIQSEVVSMSEQVYSSDFVEDIPEDLPDSKSEVSENATNNNTSLSIEEILSDHQYHSDEEPKSIISEPSVAKDNFSNVEISNKPSEKESTQGRPEESDLSDIFVVKNISDIESSPSDHQKPSIILSERITTRDDTNKLSVDEDLPTENTLKNTVVDISPIEELKMITSVKNTFSEVTPVEKIQTASSLKNILSEDIPVEKPTLESSSETPLTEMGDNSVFFDFSHEESGNVGSTINEELIKYESEGSSVADVDEPVRKTDDIQTMMDGLKFSPQFNNFSITEDFESNEAEQNFDQILNNLDSYFSVKITPINEELKILPLPDADPEEKSEMKVDAKSPEDENLSPIKITEIGFEETDVSESLEYDTTPTEHSTNQKYDIHCTVSEKTKPSSETKLDKDNEPLEIHTESVKSDADGPKKYADELSAEEDRSVEEFLEDYSIPNLGTSTFIVNDDSELEASQEMENKPASLSPVESVSEVQSDIPEQAEDLNQKINVDQTPFLEALRREHNTFNTQKQEIFENITSELFDKLLDENYASALDEITKNVDDEEDDKEKATDITNETPITKLDTKVDEAILKKHTKINNDWLDKELNFNRERLKEAEELKLQQMRIEQEIEELQAQQHIPPYLYLREIPNKPPPPYTPPSENASVRIPQNEFELQSLINPAINYVCKSLKRGIKIDDIKQLPEYTPNRKSNTEIATYRKFIFDLIKEVARNILETNKTKPCLPWDSVSKHKKPKLSPKDEDLPGIIENEILVLFGFRSKINKEKLIIQWSRKKRNDFVDDLLIKELQDEEAEWKNYEEDENIIKNQITQNILDELIQDTVDGLQEAIDKKNRSIKK